MPGEPWDTCLAKPDGFSVHFGCRGERREVELGSDNGNRDGVEEIGWLVCGCWCHYLLALDRMPPRRRCGCGAEALQYLGVLGPGIGEWEAAMRCGPCLGRERVATALELELGSPSGGPVLSLPWTRGPATPYGRLFGHENSWRRRFDPEYAKRCRVRDHGRRPKAGCDHCQSSWFRHCLELDITGYGAYGRLPEDLRTGPVEEAIAPVLAEATAGGGQEALF
jgi:hypothetical protein